MKKKFISINYKHNINFCFVKDFNNQYIFKTKKIDWRVSLLFSILLRNYM
jgi:hypothetical protein